MAKLPDQITNQQLIDALANYPPDAPVALYLDAWKSTAPYWWFPRGIDTDGTYLALHCGAHEPTTK